MNRLGLILFVLLFSVTTVWSQEKTQQQRNLESQKQEIISRIAQMEKLLKEQVRLRGSAVDQIQMLDNKRFAVESLIELTANEIQLLQRQIRANQNRKAELSAEIETIKKDYERILVNSYKRKVEKNKWLFLLAADSFKEARRRWSYMLQYASYRTAQAERLKVKQEELALLTAELATKLAEQEKKVAENRQQQLQLISDRKSQERLIDNARLKEREYRKELADR